MKRAENCVDCKINHITIRNDALVFQFAKSKGHQNGEEHVGPWHLYANPENPHICVVLSLARYLFTYPQLLKEDSSLFQGTSQYNRYAKLFLQLIADNKYELQQLGVEEGDLGTHSCRKGVATMVAGYMLNFLIESHTSSSVAKLDDYIPFTLWPNILVSDPVVVYSA